MCARIADESARHADEGPIALALMTFRILQVNYMKLVLGIEPRDPDEVVIDSELQLAEQELAPRRAA